MALLDLYGGKPNDEISSIRQLLADAPQVEAATLFNARSEGEFPGLQYDLYIISGGPGDPNDDAPLWVAMFYQWLDSIWEYNQQNTRKKQVLLICHAFQMACIHFRLGTVNERRSPTFGVYPVHLTDEGIADPVLGRLDNPFYAADFRSFQVVAPNLDRFEAIGAEMLALEKVRPHVPLERAVMAIRFSPDVLGVQFHPEVQPAVMRGYLKDPKRRERIVETAGLQKYQKMIRYLNDTSKMQKTYDTFFPTYLEAVAARLEILDLT